MKLIENLDKEQTEALEVIIDHFVDILMATQRAMEAFKPLIGTLKGMVDDSVIPEDITKE